MATSRINPRLEHMLHGADYNPDQWLHDPKVLDEDVRLMKLAGCNVMSVAIFAWSRLEPREGVYDFEWLDRTMDRLHAGGVGVMLATPTGARPAWLTKAYPHTSRVFRNGPRASAGGRHDHCPTSPVMRQKALEINTRLAERYGKHPALAAWHVNNEYGGECLCELCREAFGKWCMKQLGDMEAVNAALSADFWSRRVTDVAQFGDWVTRTVLWRQFTTDNCVSFFLDECRPLRQHSSAPLTTNFMGLWGGLDYMEFARHVDFACWDSYPHWHQQGSSDATAAMEVAFVNDMYRGFKPGKPWVLMESQPQIAKGRGVLPLKRPGLHFASSLQAVAHGSDSVQYFQWRKGRGGEEKNHGAVVDHVGHENTRGFAEVADVGRALARLDDVVGTTVQADVAMLYDWRSDWALNIDGYLGDAMHQYAQVQREHYRPLWARGVSVDVRGIDADLGKYKLVIAPMLYMLRGGIDARLAQFVQDGGELVCTFGCGMVDQFDRALLGGWPGGELGKLLGVWHEETDELYPGATNPVRIKGDSDLGLSGTFAARDICEILHLRGAQAVGTYGGEFYAGAPAVTLNNVGKGRAYYMGARMDDKFLTAFYAALERRLGLRRAIDVELPEGVTATCRTDGQSRFVFLMNFAGAARRVELGRLRFADMLSGDEASGAVELKGYDCRVLRVLPRM